VCCQVLAVIRRRWTQSMSVPYTSTAVIPNTRPPVVATGDTALLPTCTGAVLLCTQTMTSHDHHTHLSAHDDVTDDVTESHRHISRLSAAAKPLCRYEESTDDIDDWLTHAVSSSASNRISDNTTTSSSSSLTLDVHVTCWLGDTTGSASDQQSTNDRKVAGSRPTKSSVYHSVDR